MYIASKKDYSLLFKKMGEKVVFLAVHVDDILLTRKCDAEI